MKGVGLTSHWRTRLAALTQGTQLTMYFIGALCAATIALLWLGYRATNDAQQAATLLAERRVNEKLALLVAALNRDMHGAQLSVLVPLNHDQLVEGGPAALSSVFARAFARFPYPESFFAWTNRGPRRDVLHVFNRADRRPPWDESGEANDTYPVVLRRDPAPLQAMLNTATGIRSSGARFAVYHVNLAGASYEVVVHRLYHGFPAGGLFAVAGYMVNLSWVRQEYFKELARQVSNIGGGRDDMALSILDDGGHLVTATLEGDLRGPARERRFPMSFFDPVLLRPPLSTQPATAYWTARVTATGGGGPAGAGGARRMFALMALAALAAIVGLVLVTRASQAGNELMAMKWEFISTVTHELKTPLSNIRLVGETLGLGRYKSSETVREYSRLLSTEAGRLTLLIDNILAYARLTDVQGGFALEALDVSELLEEGLARCRPRLTHLNFGVSLDLPSDLPHIRGDRVSMLHVVENLLDNAIKDSRDTRLITVRADADTTTHEVRMAIGDQGSGIPEDEVSRVLDKFFRGRGAPGGGSGLGLAIVQRIVHRHGGRVDIRSVVGAGTTVTVVLPAAAA